MASPVKTHEKRPNLFLSIAYSALLTSIVGTEGMCGSVKNICDFHFSFGIKEIRDNRNFDTSNSTQMSYDNKKFKESETGQSVNTTENSFDTLKFYTTDLNYLIQKCTLHLCDCMFM